MFHSKSKDTSDHLAAVENAPEIFNLTQDVVTSCIDDPPGAVVKSCDIDDINTVRAIAGCDVDGLPGG